MRIRSLVTIPFSFLRLLATPLVLAILFVWVAFEAKGAEGRPKDRYADRW